MPAIVAEGQQQTSPHPPDLSKRLPKLTPRRRRDPADQTNDTSNSKEQSQPPPPPTPALPPPPSLKDHKFIVPRRRILSQNDHEVFLASPAYDLIVGFVFTLSDSVRGMTVSQAKKSSAAEDPTIQLLLTILDEADGCLQRCPPLETGSRFGNPAFRDFLAAIDNALPAWQQRLGVQDASAREEVAVYLSNAFGSGSRIDYGSGHELNFVLWLLCLRQLSILSDASFPAIALLVFPRYLQLMRSVQSTYYLEPAGSHGVWGLDDYQFLPFLFGASQLVDHAHLRPLSIHSALVLEECAPDFLYLDQVGWVNASKTVQGLRWHSPMLDDISAAKSWSKVEAGMRRMFLAEVLRKLPVAQHFLFGSLLPAAEGMSVEGAAERISEEDVGEVEVTVDGMRHKHVANSWGDCCGIKVPSAVGARIEARKAGAGSELRRVPFD